MRSARIVTAMAFGMLAGYSAIQHGFYEMLQGHVRPAGIMILSYGPPCQADRIWHGCEPAMTVLPDFFWTGILSMIVGLIVIIWAAAHVHRKHGGLILVLLSIAQLLVGGGIVPPVIGLVGGLIGTRIDRPLAWWHAHAAGTPLRLLAHVWPWSLGAFLIGLPGLYPVGYFWGDFLLQSGAVIMLLIFTAFLVTIPAAFAHESDRSRNQEVRRVWQPQP